MFMTCELPKDKGVTEDQGLKILADFSANFCGFHTIPLPD